MRRWNALCNIIGVWAGVIGTILTVVGNPASNLMHTGYVLLIMSGVMATKSFCAKCVGRKTNGNDIEAQMPLIHSPTQAITDDFNRRLEVLEKASNTQKTNGRFIVKKVDEPPLQNAHAPLTAAMTNTFNNQECECRGLHIGDHYDTIKIKA